MKVNLRQHKKRPLLFILVIYCTIGLFCAPQTTNADIDWTFGKERNLDVAPLDITPSSDGQWLYILSPGEIAVYSVIDDKVVSRIPIDKHIDRISYATQTNTLIISSSTDKIIKFIQLEVMQRFALEGLAIKGPENAPVTIAVFSDYQ